MADRESEERSDPPASDPGHGRDGASEGAAESLREAVEAKYDFDDFGPADMLEMTVEEWEAVFDPETWVTGPALIDRVEDELLARVASRQLFAVVERHEVDDVPRLLVYDDGSYAVVHPDGTVEGEGGLRRDVEPAVVLSSMPDYEVSSPPEGAGLPDPADIEPGGGGVGHRLLLGLAGALALAGLAVLVGPVFLALGPGSGALTTVVGLGFLGTAILLGVLVANARLSDRFRAAAYRDRLLAVGRGDGERPSFLPPMDGSTDHAGDGSETRAGPETGTSSDSNG